MNSTRRALILGHLCPVLLGLAACSPALGVVGDFNIWINEFHYDNTGGDSGEFVEVAAPASFTDLDKIRFDLYNGSNGQSYGSETLDNFTVGGTSSGFTFYTWMPSSIQNGAPDGLALSYIDGGNQVLQFLSYEGDFSATDGPANTAASTDVGVDEPGSTAVGASLQVSGLGNSYGDFTWQSPTANTLGAANTGQTFTAIDAGETPTGIGPPPPSPFDLIINEILYDPDPVLGDANGDGVVSVTEDEFVEIFNNHGSTVDLSGFSIADGALTRHVFPNGTMLPDQGSIVVFGGGAPTGSFGDSLVQLASTGALGLSNGGDTVTLFDNSAQIVDEVSYSGSTDDMSITRDPDTTGAFTAHSGATGSGGTLFSPGTNVDGTNFSGNLPAPTPSLDAFINELHYDNDGGDSGEFIELVLRPGFSDIADLQLDLYNGSNGMIYDTYDFGSESDHVIGDTIDGYTFVYVDIPGIQNGAPDGIALSLDGTLLQFLSYEGQFSGAEGVANGILSTQIGVVETNSTAVGSSLGLTGTGQFFGDFGFTFFDATATPGTINGGQSFVASATAAPEPSSLLLVGLGCLALLRRRKR